LKGRETTNIPLGNRWRLDIFLPQLLHLSPQSISGKTEDASIDPNWRHAVDFGSCFETTIVLALPVMFIVVVGGARMLYLRRRKPLRPTTSWLYLAKQAAAIVGAALCLAELWLYAVSEDYLYRIVALAVQLLGWVSERGRGRGRGRDDALVLVGQMKRNQKCRIRCRIGCAESQQSSLSAC
jgi:hypothetical protein